MTGIKLIGLNISNFWKCELIPILVSCGCCNKPLENQWLETKEIYSLTVLEIRSAKSASLCENQGICSHVSPSPHQKLQGRICSMLLSASGGCLHSLAHDYIIPNSASVVEISASCLLLFVLLNLTSFYKDTCDCI